MLCVLLSCYSRDIREINTEISQIKENSKKTDEELKRDIKEIKSTMYVNIESTKKGKATSSVLYENIKADFQSLKGHLEEIDHNLSNADKELSNQVATLKEDFEHVISELSKKLDELTNNISREISSLKSSEKTKTPNTTEIKIEPVVSFEQALDLYKRNKFPESIEAFDNFLSKNPKSKYASGAQYWKADCYFQVKEYEKAITEFQKVIDNYKKAPKMCLSILKQCFSFKELGKKNEARLFCEDVVSKCKTDKEAITSAKKIISEFDKEIKKK